MNVIQGNGFVAEIIRSSKRKSSAIKIQKGKVFVIVPESLSYAVIESLVLKKNRWINEKLNIQNQVLAIKPKTFTCGESFSYRGNPHLLKIEAGLYPAIKLSQDQLVIFVRDVSADNSKAIKQLLIKWFKQQAEDQLKEKTDHYSKIIGVTPSSITIKTFKARWGSCSITKAIQYNWKIIMAPESIINYLVVHELCHILHHNHSPTYWQEVKKYCPDYRGCGAWLKTNGVTLDI